MSDSHSIIPLLNIVGGFIIAISTITIPLLVIIFL